MKNLTQHILNTQAPVTRGWSDYLTVGIVGIGISLLSSGGAAADPRVSVNQAGSRSPIVHVPQTSGLAYVPARPSRTTARRVAQARTAAVPRSPKLKILEFDNVNPDQNYPVAHLDAN